MRTVTDCRSCKSSDLRQILDLGEQYVSDFRLDQDKPPKYPIVAVICDECKLVQLKHTTPSHEMYHDNYGFKSGISDSIKNDLKDVVGHALSYKPAPEQWLDIASNDGTLLSYVPKSVRRTGVDPITPLCEEAREHADRIINDFFDRRFFDPTYLDDGVVVLPGETFEVITSISCFYDMDDPNRFVGDVRSVLDPRGVWVIQQNYLLPTMQLNAVDNFCHEHLEYYTLMSLEHLLDRHGLEVIDVTTSMVNGGSIRTVVAHRGAYEPKENVALQRRIEAEAKLDTIEPYLAFADGVTAQIKGLRDLVDALNAEGKTVYILAASTRGATIWQSAGITEVDTPYAVERNPAKVGKYFSAIGCPIISEEQARVDKPDAMLVGPWFFAFPEIVTREKEYVLAGGSLIVPLPTLITVNKDNIHEYIEEARDISPDLQAA
jgi:NDP-4-keto-2,6-dideoxyhexose 3-C-methyltransferase